MNLPNALTILRIFFVPFLVAAMVEQDLAIQWHGAVLVTNGFLALGIFLAAAATDLLDGYLARRWKQIAGSARQPVDRQSDPLAHGRIEAKQADAELLEEARAVLPAAIPIASPWRCLPR